MPEVAQEVYFDYCFYGSHMQGGISEWLCHDGSIGFFTEAFPRPPYEAEREIMDKLQELCLTEFYARFNWNHVRVSLSEKGRINFKFAHVPEEDYWPNLFMKGASDLSDEEIARAYIPRDLWTKKVDLAIQRKERESKTAETKGNAESAAKLRAAAQALRERLNLLSAL
jgi:hypothetical protein